ncbi:kynureninase [Psychrobacter sp. AOP22-C1-22]|uniref:kynureninase n=1 Tax=unclassified Psychrobacter TaxID=196806 RepID=UPI0017889BEF|nr:kynureninase [Psychrobacter sp. FME6]MBE0407928.1 kynureninase [Psychrobacter sp. FME6]
MNKFLFLVAAMLLTSCADNNSEPKYGESSGLSTNCRAYVQAAIDEWRNGSSNTEDTMNALERNCGIHGHLWDYRP